MSWSISCMGLPENVANYLDKYSESLIGQSKVEYDAAKTHLVALVKENFAAEGNPPVVSLSASGSGYATADKQISRSCMVKIESTYIKLV